MKKKVEVYVIKRPTRGGHEYLHVHASGMWFHKRKGCKYWYHKSHVEEFKEIWKNNIDKNAIIGTIKI